MGFCSKVRIRRAEDVNPSLKEMREDGPAHQGRRNSYCPTLRGPAGVGEGSPAAVRHTYYEELHIHSHGGEKKWFKIFSARAREMFCS